MTQVKPIHVIEFHYLTGGIFFSQTISKEMEQGLLTGSNWLTLIDQLKD
jgi:hypothetical protein